MLNHFPGEHDGVSTVTRFSSRVVTSERNVRSHSRCPGSAVLRRRLPLYFSVDCPLDGSIDGFIKVRCKGDRGRNNHGHESRGDLMVYPLFY